MEVYNEEVRDLLHPEISSKAINIREDCNGNIIMAGVQEVAVSSGEEVQRLMQVCVCLCVCVCMYVCIYVSMYVCMYVCM